jgi:hypothetical protein
MNRAQKFNIYIAGCCTPLAFITLILGDWFHCVFFASMTLLNLWVGLSEGE